MQQWAGSRCKHPCYIWSYSCYWWWSAVKSTQSDSGSSNAFLRTVGLGTWYGVVVLQLGWYTQCSPQCELGSYVNTHCIAGLGPAQPSNTAMQSLGVFFKKSETIFEKNVLLYKGPPFGFLGIYPTAFWPIPWVNLKLETSSFHKWSSFCDMRKHVSAWIETQRNCSTLHPYSLWHKAGSQVPS